MDPEDDALLGQWFYYHDPFQSFMTGNPPAWRDRTGRTLKAQEKGDGSHALLNVAAESVRELFGDSPPTAEKWDAVVQEAQWMVREARDALPMDRMAFVSPSGEKTESLPDGAFLSPFNILSVYHQAKAVASQVKEPEMTRLLRELWCIVCLYETDRALGSELFRDCGSGVPSAIAAVQALANAKALDPSNLPFKDMAKRGAMARHTETRAIKRDVFEWLDQHKALDLNGDETAGEIAGKVAPVAWRTARDYVTEWKKLRSAGKP